MSYNTLFQFHYGTIRIKLLKLTNIIAPNC